MASIVASPSSVAQQSSTAPTLSTDRLVASAVVAPPYGTPTAVPDPHEDYRGWASL